MAAFQGFAVLVSTHSRLKAAGLDWAKGNKATYVSTHSRLKAAGYKNGKDWYLNEQFQHTAA